MIIDDIVSKGFSLQYLSDYENYIKWQYTLLSFNNIIHYHVASSTILKSQRIWKN